MPAHIDTGMVLNNPILLSTSPQKRFHPVAGSLEEECGTPRDDRDDLDTQRAAPCPDHVEAERGAD